MSDWLLLSPYSITLESNLKITRTLYSSSLSVSTVYEVSSEMFEVIFARDTAFDVNRQWKILVYISIVTRNTLPSASLDIYWLLLVLVQYWQWCSELR